MIQITKPAFNESLCCGANKKGNFEGFIVGDTMKEIRIKAREKKVHLHGTAFTYRI